MYLAFGILLLAAIPKAARDDKSFSAFGGRERGLNLYICFLVITFKWPVVFADMNKQIHTMCAAKQLSYSNDAAFKSLLHHTTGGITMIICILCLIASGVHGQGGSQQNALKGRVIFLDPGHGGTADTDAYRVGPTGEREEWVNLRVALVLRDMLKAHGARVVMSRTSDSAVSLRARAETAKAANAEVFVSIHHNATADTSVNFPIIYFHGNASENRASVRLAQLAAKELRSALFDDNGPVSIVSDHVIFPRSGTAVLRHSYGIPGIIGEATFFTNPAEERRLKDRNYNRREAAAYLAALETFFSREQPPVAEKYSLYRLPPFEVLQEAERMRPEARRWLQDYREGKQLLQDGKLENAYRRLTRSARSFPDSYVAREVHLLRAEALDKMDSTAAAQKARLRAREYFANL
jgi:N-acetylmuramoyl-L-alanine amidase